MKKLLVIFGAVTIAIVGASMFAAFEAHVINVTATIENALTVPTTPILFGTVFPQEQIDKHLSVALSSSFLAENQGRVDTVNYMIRQKPKCGFTTDNGKNLIGETRTGEVVIDANSPGGYRIDCGVNPNLNPTTDTGAVIQGTWGVLPSLCPYLSKHSSNATDVNVPAFHQPFSVANGVVSWTEAEGTLSKPNQTSADWTIDLKVPCFGGHCAQDWNDFVKKINPLADPAAYTQPIANEHKVFGCDLWVETTGVNSKSREIPLYKETGDSSTTLGPIQGHVTYDTTSAGKLAGTIKVDSGSLVADHNYVLVLNGPRGGGVLPGNTNGLLADWACLQPTPGLSNGWDGWWVNQTDNTGATKCELAPGDVKLEGYYNFQFNVTGAQLEAGYSFNPALPVGTYSGVQFLVKDLNTALWDTVLEYPGVGETDSTPSEFSFVVN
ncbi:MAG: hypothetical protein WCX12_00970 [Candidatus Paceibacterota bacterium]|jgi:hypothetical protein